MWFNIGSWNVLVWIQMISVEHNQTLLHQALKHHYALSVGGEEEVDVSSGGKRYRVDVLDQARSRAFEIQLEHFGKQFYSKIDDISHDLFVTIVHPVPTIQHASIRTGAMVETRTVHKRNDFYSLFDVLVHFKIPFNPSRFKFEILLTEERIFQEHVGFKRGRPLYRLVSRELINVLGSRHVSTAADFIAFLPPGLPRTFTNKDIAGRLSIKGGTTRRKKIASRITYSLRLLGLLRVAGKQGRLLSFELA